MGDAHERDPQQLCVAHILQIKRLPFPPPELQTGPRLYNIEMAKAKDATELRLSCPRRSWTLELSQLNSPDRTCTVYFIT